MLHHGQFICSRQEHLQRLDLKINYGMKIMRPGFGIRTVP
ncbi:protein of unknown function [Methylococcus capsulatus]|uniref:Uncharacterized protein n=1 Tax=Methylococcus capsulatus TaxID=414 RepID=A0AA35UKL1_METCP|nr:protein of unknown function [Methylococcus capsulatus]